MDQLIIYLHFQNMWPASNNISIIYCAYTNYSGIFQTYYHTSSINHWQVQVRARPGTSNDFTNLSGLEHHSTTCTEASGWPSAHSTNVLITYISDILTWWNCLYVIQSIPKGLALKDPLSLNAYNVLHPVILLIFKLHIINVNHHIQCYIYSVNHYLYQNNNVLPHFQQYFICLVVSVSSQCNNYYSITFITVLHCPILQYLLLPMYY